MSDRYMGGAVLVWSAIFCGVLAVQSFAAAQLAPRPPAVPLITHTPYFSVWSRGDGLTDVDTTHWGGAEQRLAGLVRVDGKTYRVLGTAPQSVPALEQTSLEITPTRSIYRFANDAVEVTLTFASPMIASDLELVGRPVSYVVWDVQSKDGRPHEVQMLLSVGAGIAAGEDHDALVWSREEVAGLTALKIGTEAQPVLGRAGDRVRIDWGYAWLAATTGKVVGSAGVQEALLQAFVKQGTLPAALDHDMPRAASAQPSLALATDLGTVSQSQRSYQMLAYDDVQAHRYFGRPLNAWWRRDGATMGQVLQTAAEACASILQRCATFDGEVMADAERVGGPKYAYICALAYRQAMASSVLAADANGMPLLFNKEISSFGLSQTVDVIYPMAPQMLLFSPALTKAMLQPVLDYTSSKLWPFPYACHDIGMYPLPDGNVYGGMEPGKDPGRMPVEESANMLLMVAAVAHQQRGDVAFAKPYWETLQRWADYLAEYGIDPVEQLCTDDFAGHLARNANLSIKAILGIGAMARLCEMAGDTAGQAKYRALAEGGVKRWLKLADAGDHYTLVLEAPQTWSLKYNLVWDRILGLKLFPEEVAQREARFYQTKLNKFGVPLDSRQEDTGMTKADWLVWSAMLGDAQQFHALIDALYAFYEQVPQRDPMTDWYRTKDGQQIGFIARPVVGGVFLPFLYDAALWNKWADAAQPLPEGKYAPLPTPPTIKAVIVPAADREPAAWRYTTTQPTASNWSAPDFDDSAWASGQSGFGTRGTPGATVNTTWDTSDIWLRRTITLPTELADPIWLYVHHDENAQVYFNGKLAAALGGFVAAYQAKPITGDAAREQLKPGAKVTIAVHCHQTGGGQYIDLGLVTMDAPAD